MSALEEEKAGLMSALKWDAELFLSVHFFREESVALFGFSKWSHDHCPLESLKNLLEILMPGHHSQGL